MVFASSTISGRNGYDFPTALIWLIARKRLDVASLSLSRLLLAYHHLLHATNIFALVFIRSHGMRLPSG